MVTRNLRISCESFAPNCVKMGQNASRNSFFLRAAPMAKSSLQGGILKKNSIDYQAIINGVALSLLGWALTDSNRRPSACKADALNQLS